MIKQLLADLQATPVGTAIRESTWLFPTVETLHVLSLVLVVGSIIIVDLRLLNHASRERSVRELSDDVLPWTWAAFVSAAITGSLLFSSSALRYVGIWQFDAKMCLLVVAAINMLIFQRGIYRSVDSWDRPPAQPPAAAKLAGGVSLFLWISIVGLGRFIGFM